MNGFETVLGFIERNPGIVVMFLLVGAIPAGMGFGLIRLVERAIDKRKANGFGSEDHAALEIANHHHEREERLLTEIRDGVRDSNGSLARLSEAFSVHAHEMEGRSGCPMRRHEGEDKP